MDSTIRPLLNHLFDYAGLFPPAKLSMESAVENYARYREGSFPSLLGRMIVPVARLKEFADLALPIGGRWALSVIGQADWEEDLATIQEFNAGRSSDRDLVIESMERRFASTDRIPRDLGSIDTYCEISSADTASFDLLADHKLSAKVRCGGLDQQAFPSDKDLASFIVQCHERSLSFKATAGLHHPIKSTRPATSSEGADVVDMHGFLNLTIACSLLHAGLIDSSQVESVLAVRDVDAFEVSPTHIVWQGRSLDVDQIESTRDHFFHGLGSCSFVEPIEDLQELKLHA